MTLINAGIESRVIASQVLINIALKIFIFAALKIENESEFKS